MKLELGKNIATRELEEKIQKFWDSNDFWSNDVVSSKPPFCVMMPPPNITGSLHMGHALNNVLTDFIVRYKRMSGFDCLWQPGTDHAAIATQMMIEKNLSKNKINPKALSKEELFEYAYEWKDQYGGTIINQLHSLGVTPVWKRERFTMDDGLSNAVTKVFVKLYNDGLIYKDKKLVNWCPKQQTAVSDLEVITKEEKGKFYYINYELKEGGFIEIATTRPETIFADKAIAIHKDNEKLKHLIGKVAKIPLTDIYIPIIADDHADPSKGTGAVKITPAHDKDDYEVGLRHNLEQLNILTPDAKLNENVPVKYQGLDRFEARKKIIEDLETQGLLVKVEDKSIPTPYSERGDCVIEYYLTEQWFMNVKPLAEVAIKAVDEGKIKFLPEHRYNLYMAWMKDIRPWTISRQLWWGHQIPAWYNEEGNIYVAETEVEAQKQAGNKKITQDTDTLDTWFSSALWPFSTLGWPEETPELEKYYPTDLLITAADIIFFWVARMIMMSLYFMKDVPFKTVYFNGLVRDKNGQKFSKTKGNGTDPLEEINKFGADAVRYWVSQAPIGTDLRYNEEDVKRGTKLTNKLWNASKFVLMNLEDFDPQNHETIETKNRFLEDRWVLSELNKTIANVRKNMDKYDTFNAREEVDSFFWSIFCDQYLEYIKDRFWNEDKYGANAKLSAQITLFEVLREILGLYSIFIPFITEELYDKIYKPYEKTQTLHLTDYPTFKEERETDVSKMDIALDILKTVRKLRTDKQYGATAKLSKLIINGKIDNDLHGVLISGARADEIVFDTASEPVENQNLKIDIVVKDQV
ncbi:MAG: valine--tRNA ligase [Rickettsiales bacterium]|jgi:valyl-tRNA synthetase|nr:valine--tRNA ligase [Rickettsiales bacterium]